MVAELTLDAEYLMKLAISQAAIPSPLSWSCECGANSWVESSLVPRPSVHANWGSGHETRWRGVNS